MMPRKKRMLVIIISIAMILFIALMTFLIIFLKTDMFKSDQKLFAKYIEKNIDNIESVSKIFEKDEYEKSLDKNKYTVDTEIKVNYTENLGTSLENNENIINKLKLTVNEQVDKNNMYDYKDVKLLANDEKALEIECINKDNLYGIKFKDLFKQYISEENSNLKNLLKRLGYSEDEIKYIPEQIQFNDDLYSILGFTEEEKQAMKDKYLNNIVMGMSKENFSKNSDLVINVNEKDIKVDAYTVTITKEQLNNIFLNILEILKQDEIILSRLDKIQNILQQNENYNIKEEFVSNIEETISEITRNNIGNEESKIIVYVSDGETVRTTIQNVEYEINLDYIKTQEEEYIQINKEIAEQENNQSISLKKVNDEITFKINNLKEEGKNITVVHSKKIEGDTCNKNIVAKLEESENKVEAIIGQTINRANEFEQIELNDENNINLNELEEEQAKKIIETVSAGVSQKINKLSETIKKEELIKVLEVIGVVKSNEEFEDIGISETEKNRFNSQFEILKGENLGSDSILKTIEAIKNNLIDIDVVSNTEIKLEIDRDDKKEDLQQKLIDFVEKDKNRKYNVDVEYDDQTGLIKYIILTLIER